MVVALVALVARIRAWLHGLRDAVDEPFDADYPCGPDSAPQHDFADPLPEDISCPAPLNPHWTSPDPPPDQEDHRA